MKRTFLTFRSPDFQKSSEAELIWTHPIKADKPQPLCLARGHVMIHDLPQRRLHGHDDEVAGLGTVNMNGRGDVSVMDNVGTRQR